MKYTSFNKTSVHCINVNCKIKVLSKPSTYKIENIHIQITIYFFIEF